MRQSARNRVGLAVRVDAGAPTITVTAIGCGGMWRPKGAGIQSQPTAQKSDSKLSQASAQTSDSKTPVKSVWDSKRPPLAAPVATSTTTDLYQLVGAFEEMPFVSILKCIACKRGKIQADKMGQDLLPSLESFEKKIRIGSRWPPGQRYRWT